MFVQETRTEAITPFKWSDVGVAEGGMSENKPTAQPEHSWLYQCCVRVFHEESRKTALCLMTFLVLLAGLKPCDSEDQ